MIGILATNRTYRDSLFMDACCMQVGDELLYMPMWVANWSFQEKGVERRRNFHVEPYILGKFLKFNSNGGYVNMKPFSEHCQVGGNDRVPDVSPMTLHP